MTEHVMLLHTCTLHAVHGKSFLDGTSLVECSLVHLGSLRLKVNVRQSLLLWVTDGSLLRQ